MNFLSKKSLVFLSLVLVVLYALLQWYKISNLCTFNGAYHVTCGNILFDIKTLSLYASFALTPLFLTLPTSTHIFEAWKKFALWAVPIVLILTFLISRMSDGGGVGVVGFHPGLILLPVLYGLYFLVSFAIIIVTAVRERRKRKQN